MDDGGCLMANNKFIPRLWRYVSLLILVATLAACLPANPETAVSPTTPTDLPIATSVSTPETLAPTQTADPGPPTPISDLPTPTPIPATTTPEPPQIFSGPPIKVGRGQILDAAFLPDGDSQAIAIGWANGVSLAALDGTERWWQPTDALLIALDASPQGDRIAAVLEDGSVVVLATEDGAMQQYAASRPYVYWSDIAFSPDGQQVAFQSIGPLRHDPIFLLDLRNDQVHEVPQSRMNEGVKPFLVWSPDGQTLTHAALGGSCSSLLNQNTGETQLTLRGESGCYAPWTAAFTPDGQQLAVAAPNGGIDLLQADSGQVIEQLPGSVVAQPDQTVRLLQFSPDGRWLTTPGGFSFYGDTFPAIVWDVANARVQAELPPTERVRRLAQTFAGDKLLSVYEDGRITHWPFTENNAAETAVAQVPVIAPYLDFNWSANSSRLAAPLRFGGAAVWEAATGNQVALFPAPFTDPRLSPDGRLLALFNPETQEISLHDLDRGEPVSTIPDAASLPAADPFSPNGQWLAYGSGSELRLLSLTSGETIALAGYPNDQILARVIWSPQSDALIAASAAIDERPGTVILWEKTSDVTFTAVHQTESMRSGYSCCVTIAAFSPNGERAAFEPFPNWEGSSLVVEVYDRQQGKVILREKEYELNAWLTNDVLLTNEAGYDTRLTTWNVVTRQKTISTASASGGGEVYSPDGFYYAVISGTGPNIGRAIAVHQWQARSSAGKVNFGNDVITLRWSPDGRWLAALATDSSLWLWPVTLPEP